MDKHHLCGLNDHYIDRDLMSCGLHRDIIRPFRALQASASEFGFELDVVSAYRDFDRQLHIWNAKARGERPVLDADSKKLDVSLLEPWELVQAILRWSALPGASRHHWGTDVDVYDRRAVSEDYSVQLVDAEVTGDGPFAAMHDWLDQRIDHNEAEGFFRPYQLDKGGIAPERWHLSYGPLAFGFQLALDVDTLYSIVESHPVALKDTILEHIEEIYQRFILVDLDIYPTF
jgi:LAS superfamily LD-carboxypeptidase LdcB